MASSRDVTVYSSGRISTLRPASSAVFAVMGPIQAIRVFFISSSRFFPVNVRKLVTVDEEVKVRTSISPDLSLFKNASDFGFGKTVW